MRRIALLALTVLAAASCEKHDLDTSDLQLTLNGKPYALQEQNTLSGLPGTTFDFNVTGKRLNAILNQRSQDMLAANNWNVVQYAVLTMMIAQVSGFEPGEFVHVIADAHIYDRHVPAIEEIIRNEPKPAPRFFLDPDVKDFYAFTRDSFRMENYEYSDFTGKIPVAV